MMARIWVQIPVLPSLSYNLLGNHFLFISLSLSQARCICVPEDAFLAYREESLEIHFGDGYR